MTLTAQEYVLSCERMKFVQPVTGDPSYMELDEKTPKGAKVTDPPKESERTVFMLKPLSATQWFEFHDMIERGSKSGARQLYLLERGIVGWKNMKSAKGGDIPFPPENALDLLPGIYRQELASQIHYISQLSEEESKN